MLDYYDSLLVNYNPSGVLFTFAIWCIMLLLAKPNITISYPINNNKSRNTFLFFLLFSTVCILGLHRWDTYHITETNFIDNYEHIEPVHAWIREHLAGRRELVYRFINWGISVALYCLSAIYAGCYTRNFCLACVLFLVDSMFPEMRGTSGYVLLLFGIILLYKSKCRKSNIAIGLICIISSLFFHRSIFICCIFAIISLFPFDKKVFVTVSWIVYPLLIILLNKFFVSILGLVQQFDFGNMGIADSVALYGESDFSFGSFNLTGLITRGLIQSPLYIAFFYLSNKICFNNNEVDTIIKYLYRWYYLCFYIGCLLSHVETSAWLAVRVKVMALFPLPLLLASFWNEERRSSIWTKMIILFGILGGLLSFYIRYRDWV